MCKSCTLALLAIARVAFADAAVPVSVPVPVPVPVPVAGGVCPPIDGPATQAWKSPLAKRLADRLPIGVPVSPRHVTDHHVLYSSDHGYPRSVLLDANGRLLLDTPQRTVAVVEDPSGRALGLLALHPGERGGIALLSPSNGERLWASPRGIGGADSASVALAGDTLLIALYHRIASGADLTALDLRTGEVRWNAAVLQLRIPHSQYLNDVTVGLRGRDAILIGLEAGGCYVQAFDLADGQRRSAFLVPDPGPPR
jgi:PQQ-like domain